ncbi:hypothetical protein AB3S75_047655 [Citrus x aurantiifolia]
MDVGGSSVQRGDMRINEFVTLREIASEVKEKAMYERMERIEKHMETLTNILHELRSEQRGIQEERIRSGGFTPGHVDRRDDGEGTDVMRVRTTRRFSSALSDQSLRGRGHEGRGQSPRRQNSSNNDGVVNAEERELRQHLRDIEQERDQVAAYDPGRVMQLKEEVRTLAHIIDDMQGRNRALGWIIILDGESPLSAEIMSAVIPKDFLR